VIVVFLGEAMAMVVQEGGFDKAARMLRLTQCAVSQRVKLLEELTGQVLLTRTSPPRATPYGQLMLEHYQKVKRLEGDLLDSLSPSTRDGFVSVAVGINADSLATWFMDAIGPLLEQERVVLDLRVDDQEQTHRLLKNGEVVGCISSQTQTVQECHSHYLGCMEYRLLATPSFAARWFARGLSLDSVRCAPAVVFNRKDDLHNKIMQQALGVAHLDIPLHYIPSSEKFVDFIAAGFAYGLLPDQQGAPLVKSGKLIDLLPSHCIPVKLYWHCWNIKSALLEKLTRRIVRQDGVLPGS
jgi:LysR family transcriptional regulator (chromosome initiation inhibitor)